MFMDIRRGARMNRAVNILLIMALLLVPTVVRGNGETVRLASGEWAPYQSEKLKYAGVASRMVTEAFALEGISVKYGYFPWSRSFEQAKNGEWDGTFLWFDTPERREYFHVSDPIISIRYVFFHNKDNEFDWNSVSDLKDRSIGGTFKYTYGPAFDQAEKAKRIKVERVASDELNFKKLARGRIELFPCDLDAGLALIRDTLTPDQAGKITWHPKPLKADPHHLLLSKAVTGNDELMKKFNSGLKKLRDSGKVDQYLEESRRGLYIK
jgi:polar amino acid transport system substrate-binding protein